LKTQLRLIATSKSAETLAIWTIGHSNRSKETFMELLREHGIEVLVDVRSFPTSKIEHFKREEMQRWLPEHRVEYVWLGKELGGYRHGGYRAHMRTKLYKNGIQKLLEIAAQKRTCLMCMEPNPKYCHRRYISAHLERKGIEINHIVAKGQASVQKF